MTVESKSKSVDFVDFIRLLSLHNSKCLVLQTQNPPLSSMNVREYRKANILYKYLISAHRPIHGLSTTSTISLLLIVFSCESKARALSFRWRFLILFCLTSTTFPCMESTWKFSRSICRITPTVCASSCTKSPDWNCSELSRTLVTMSDYNCKFLGTTSISCIDKSKNTIALFLSILTTKPVEPL